MDLGDWLRSLGLEQYEVAFRENAIDKTVLHDLTEDHLRELGLPLGARLKLLKAIAALGLPAKAAGPSARVAPIGPHVNSAERRQVTVMFSDLVGSTALSTHMDPEDLREVITVYQKCVAETVRRCGGFVAKYMGDGVLVYFGYPQADEDDAERAVRAGLELIAAVGALKSVVALQTRVGIATGLVVVGDLIGSGEAQERGIVGETPNLAARLQGIAEPNMVVIAEDTRKLLGNLFELQDLGPKDLKGIAGPVRAWAALRPSEVESRFEAMHASGLTALVGREEEIELLLRRWARTKSGEGQLVLLSGEAGIGKSQLTAALLQRVAGEPHTRLRYFCSPQHTHSAFYPIIGQMERAAGLVHDDTAQAKLDKLDALLPLTSISKQDAALFSEMLSLPNDGRYPALELTALQRRQKTMEALSSQMEALSRKFPVLMIFEDTHWTDPTTLEFFGRAVDRIANLRVLLLVTFRPEFQPPWIGRSHVTALTLNRLAQRDIAAMIDRVVGNKHLPTNIRHDIIERTDGIPLFIEEMTKAVLEAEGEGEARRTAAAVPSPRVAVPASLHASLMARLDRLGTAKEVAQIGAAIGREFSYALLAAVVRKPEAELNSTLDQLTDSGLLFRQGLPPHASYLFKHALVQDAAYGTLLREPRRALHARIGHVIEEQFADIAENQPELLAHHFTQAGFDEAAIVWWGKAGDQSLRRSAFKEAIAHLGKAIEMADETARRQASSAVSSTERLRLQTAYGQALLWAHGHAAQRTKSAFARARELASRVENAGDRFSAYYGLWVGSFTRGEIGPAREMAELFLREIEAQPSLPQACVGHRIFGTTCWYVGDFGGAHHHLGKALALYDGAEHGDFANRFGQDIAVSAEYFDALTLYSLGHVDQALARADQALADAQLTAHVPTLVQLHFWRWFLGAVRLNVNSAAADAQAASALVSQHDIRTFAGYTTFARGWVSWSRGERSSGMAEMLSGMSLSRDQEYRLALPFYETLVAKAEAEAGEVDAAITRLNRAFAEVEQTGERWHEAEMHRIRGEILFKRDAADTAPPEEAFQTAIAIAREQKAKSWELRAATSLARLWRDQGRRNEARELLAPIYGWFTEGFDTLDLKKARAMLDELHAD